MGPELSSTPIGMRAGALESHSRVRSGDPGSHSLGCRFSHKKGQELKDHPERVPSLNTPPIQARPLPLGSYRPGLPAESSGTLVP